MRKLTNVRRVMLLTLACLVSVYGVAVDSTESALPHINPETAETHIITKARPPLPSEAEKLGLSGSVVLEVEIGPGGDVRVLRTISGHPLLVQAATDAVRQWKYQPFMADGTATAVRTEVVVLFSPVMPRTSHWKYWLIVCLPYVLIVAAWVRLIGDEEPSGTSRYRWLRFGIILLTLSLAALSVELLVNMTLHRYLPFGRLRIFAWANEFLCIIGGILCLAGKGKAQLPSLSAAPLLLFIWATHLLI